MQRGEPPKPTEWSPLQVREPLVIYLVIHLVIYEETVKQWMQAAFGTQAKPSMKGRLSVGLIGAMRRSGLRTPMRRYPPLQASAVVGTETVGDLRVQVEGKRRGQPGSTKQVGCTRLDSRGV